MVKIFEVIMKPKWLKEKSIKEIANKKEKDYAKEIGGKVVGVVRQI